MKSHEISYYKRAEEHGSYHTGDRADIVAFIKSHYKPRDHILEIGCGSGGLADALPEDVDYLGLDVSSYAISQAEGRRNGSKANFHFSVLERDQPLPMLDSTFDFILCIYTLEHLKRPQFYLSEMARVLRTGGYFILLAPNLEFPFSLPHAVRHRSSFYRVGLRLRKIYDYLLRVCGQMPFRVLESNFTEATGKYEKPDDDLTYLVSSYEVYRYLEKYGHFTPVYKHSYHGGVGWKAAVKRLVTHLPSMKHFGVVLFAIMKKNNRI